MEDARREWEAFLEEAVTIRETAQERLSRLSQMRRDLGTEAELSLDEIAAINGRLDAELVKLV